ncbi:MAG: hypothetical protein A2Y81_03865 [Nitrospirae bacterium RBG_13_43_8]|nr:MAG: hypothetical protein A2Y81_03865 [Nitrospirae bacterium RBG_13_43_8]
MHIRTYFLSSFLVHAVFLLYLVSLPLHKPIVETGSYRAYFVNLKSERDLTARIPSLAFDANRRRPETRGKLRDTKTTLESKETDAEKDTVIQEAKREAISEKESEVKETPQEETARTAEVKEPEEPQKVVETPKEEVSALEEKKQEPPKNEPTGTTIRIKETAPLPRSPNLSQVDKNESPETRGITILPPQDKPREKSIDTAKLKIEETGKKSAFEKKEALQEKAAPTSEVRETALPQKIEEPLNEIHEGDKPDTKETEKIEVEKKPSTGERLPSPDVKKIAAFEEIENVSKAKSPLEQNKIAGSMPEKGPSGTTAEGKPKAPKRKSWRAGSDKNLVRTPRGLKEGALIGKVQGEAREQRSLLEKTKQSSQESSSASRGEGKQQTIIQTKQEGKGKSDIEDKTPSPGIPISEALVPISEVLVPSDLKIEVSLRKPSAFHSEPVTTKVPVSAGATKQENMPKATEITDISLEEISDGIRVQLTGNGSMNPKVFALDKNRIVIDLPKTSINTQLPSNVVSHLKEIRSGKHKDKSRLVLDLDEEMPFDVLSSGKTVIVAVQKHKNKSDPPPIEQKTQEKTEDKELKETDISNISMRLLKNPHPKSDQKEKQVEVTLLEGKKEAHSGDKSTVKRAFSVLRTAEGAYTFIVKNEENAVYETDLAFLIFQGKKGERTKNFTAVRLSPHTSVRFKFLLPEAIFWEDEEYFSGKIENSETMTKFNEKTGIVWKETKDE